MHAYTDHTVRIFKNAIIYTVNPDKLWVDLIAIGQNGKILAVGTEEEISAYIRPETKITDLKQKLVLPGFQDVHLHALEAGMNDHICIFPEAERPKV